MHLEYLRSNKIYEDLLEGKIDLGVVAYPAKRSQIVTIAFRHDELVLVVPPEDSSGEAQQSERSAQLVGQRFVGYERDIATRKASDRILREYGVRPHYTMEFDNIETIKRAVEIGQGVAIVPRSTVELETSRGSLKMLEFIEGPFTRPLAIIYKRGRELSPGSSQIHRSVDHQPAANARPFRPRCSNMDGRNRGMTGLQKHDRTERQDRGDRLDRAGRTRRSKRLSEPLSAALEAQ